jgi:Raf kinase inhibitor-like YbhB/YbcL family protein
MSIMMNISRSLRGEILRPAVLVLVSLQSSLSTINAQTNPGFNISSPSYAEGAMLDKRHAASERDCGGQNISPPLAWAGAPPQTRSFAIIVNDPDGSNGQGVVHWVAYDISPKTKALPEGAGSRDSTIVTGTNSHGNKEFYGACPPVGHGEHHYIYQLYALDIPQGTLKPGLTRDELLAAIKGHTLANASVVFRYVR